MTTQGKILVTGATGTIGAALVHALHHAKASFVAAIRDVEKAKEKLGANVPTVVFDFDNHPSFEKATEGVDRVFLLGPPLHLTMDKLLIPFIDFLKSKSITRVVYVSAFGMEKISDRLPFHKSILEKLHREGFQLTTLLPSFFAQNFKNYEGENITKYKMTYTPAGNGKVGFVDAKDIAAVAAKVLTTEGHVGKEYILTGPESLSYAQAAQLLTEVTKETISYPAPTAEEYTQTLKAAGAPDFIAPYMTTVYSLISNNHVDYISPDIEKLLGRKPGSLRNVLEKAFAA